MRQLFVVATLAAAAAFAFAPGAFAATFVVNSTADANDANPGDGNCASALVAGPCTLRAAVEETNALPGADAIIVPAGTYVISSARARFGGDIGDFDIVDSTVSICGDGTGATIIDGNYVDRVFHIRQNSKVLICDLTIRNGKTAAIGGGIYVHSSQLNLTSTTITGNHANNGGGLFASNSNVAVIQSTISGNTAVQSSGGIRNANGTLVVQRSSISGNSAAVAGGMSNSGSLELTTSSIRDNSASFNGGGIVTGAIASTSITESAITGNTAPGSGGVQNSGDLTITNSTISGNIADECGPGTITVPTEPEPGCGGGGLSNTGTAKIVNTTIAQNVHQGLDVGTGTMLIRNSILANDENCHTSFSSGFNSISSLGHNLESGNTCGFTAAGDLVNTNPGLGPLGDHGGPTETHALLAGSPAINAAGACPATDQRGSSRPFGVCDIGAYEKAASLDLAVDKTVNSPIVQLGTLLTFLVTVVNYGPESVDGVVVSDSFPTSLTLVSARPSQGSCRTAGSGVVCELGSLRPDGEAELRVEARAVVPGVIENQAFVSSPDSEDNLANNSALVATTVLGR